MTLHHDELIDRLVRAETLYMTRNWRILGWRDVWTMEGRYDKPREGFANMMTNSPYTVVKLASAMMSRNIPYLSSPSNDKDPDRALAIRREGFGYALLRETDRLAFMSGHDLFRHELAQMINVDGWYAVQALLGDGNDPYSPLDTFLLDPVDVLPEYQGRRQTAVFVRVDTSVGEAKRQYGQLPGIDLADTDTIIYVSAWHWQDGVVWNTIMLVQGIDKTILPPKSASRGNYSLSRLYQP